MSEQPDQPSPDAVAPLVARGPQNAPATVVVANGCFDCLHAGHIALLEFAREQGDRLIVLVNSDESVRRLKGPGRPIWPFDQRMAVLQACRYVDEVIRFDEDTPEEMLRILKPDVLVKGGDYNGRDIPGSGYCGRVLFAPLLEGISTSRIVSTIKGESP